MPPPSSNVKIKHSKLLIVEGKDEENFFAAALSPYLGVTDIQVLGIGGKTLLTNNLKALKNDPAFGSVECIAILRDADLTPFSSTVPAALSAFDSVKNSLTTHGVHLDCPSADAQFTTSKPRIGVYIVPDGKSDGMLETLCMNSVSSRPEFTCVTDFFACCQSHGAVPNNIHKALTHAWLASRVEPDKRVGEAALAGLWNFAEPAFADLWAFIQTM